MSEDLAFLKSENERLREENADLNSTMNAWFDMRELALSELGPTFKRAFSGYLRVCRSGGMSGSLSNQIAAAMDHFVDLHIGEVVLPFITTQVDRIVEEKSHANKD